MDYVYYIRPFIPFWSLQSLRFEDVNKYNKMQPQRDKKYPRYVMEKLTRTWIKKDKEWFDQKEVYEALKEDIVDMIDSKFPATKKLRKCLTEYFFKINYNDFL